MVFNPGYALGTARVETQGENKAIRMHAQNQYIAACNTSRGLYATGLIQYAAILQWALKVARPVKGYYARNDMNATLTYANPVEGGKKRPEYYCPF